jgi:hypothetical protein
MYLLYLDESGNENDPSDRYFVLGGIALFERQTYFLTQAVEDIQRRHFPGMQPIPFHASEMRSGRNFWRSVDTTIRQSVLSDLLQAVVKSPAPGRALFGAAIEKSEALYGEDAVARATEEVCRRFDLRLQREYRRGNAKRGLIVFSEGRFTARAKVWVREFRRRGTQWGAINNLADIPYFSSPQESRLLQVADIISHAIWLLYERSDSSLFRPLARCFDECDGVLHGLSHVRPSGAQTPCDCPACTSRRRPRSLGAWLED